MPHELKHKSFLLLVGGLPATGKTWFARTLADKLDVIHINSDTLRSELGLRGHYEPASKQLVYEAMLERGEQTLKNGYSLIVDSTFYLQKLRKPWLQLAEKYGIPCFFIEITVPDEIAFGRLRQSRQDSEATLEVYLKLKTAWEDIGFPHLKLDSSHMSLAEMVAQAMFFISENHDTRTG